LLTDFLYKEFGDILTPSAILDSYRGGHEYRGFIVKSPGAGIRGNAYVLLSSYDSQEEMAAIIEKEGAGEKIVRLYDNPIAYDTWRGDAGT